MPKRYRDNAEDLIRQETKDRQEVDRQQDYRGDIQDKKARRAKLGGWVRWSLGVFTAVVISYFATLYIARDFLINSCERGTEFKKNEIAFVIDAVHARRNQGDNDVADRYQRIADRMEATLKPCKEAFPPPIPWID